MILDYMLPDVNGNIVSQRIRENAELLDTRILFVSGVVNRSEIEELLESGGDAFLKKPFNVTTLLGEIERLLELEPSGARQSRDAS